MFLSSFNLIFQLGFIVWFQFNYGKFQIDASGSDSFEILHHKLGSHHEIRNHAEPKHTFDVRRVFPSSTALNDPKLFDELQVYINQHNQDVVKTDPDFCHRTFVVGTYACPHTVRDHMHEFLNSVIGGFITNRTLLWRFCDRHSCKVDNLGDCDAVLTRHSWILSYADFLKIWEERRCSWSNVPFELIGRSSKEYADEIAMCCGLDRLNHIIPIINFGNHDLHQFFSFYLPNVRLLYPNARYRAKLLFRVSEDYGYGIMFRSSFQVKSFIIEKNNQLIQNHLKRYYSSLSLESQPPFFISIHLQQVTKTEIEDNENSRAYHCIHAIIPKFYKLLQMMNDNTTSLRPCVILFSSNNYDSVEFWNRWKVINNKVNCSILTAHHSKSPPRTEHGSSTSEMMISEMMISEMDLLSRGDIFIGSSSLTSSKIQNFVSSFSLLIAELRATNGLEYSTSFFSMWLPDCISVLGAARNPKKMYIDHKLDCKKIIETPVTLHAACPYSNETFTPLKR